MQFNIGDSTDMALVTTISHEMLLCHENFEEFASFAKANIQGRKDKHTKIKSYNAYSSFLHHLYEFYVACLQRDLKNTKKLDYKFLDNFFNGEVKRLLKSRVDAIKGGYAPSWENHISVYQIDVPDNFGEQFRKIRNRTAHASTKRSQPENDMSLIDFYNSYHQFVYLLYYAGLWWLAKDIESPDWKDIEDFDIPI